MKKGDIVKLIEPMPTSHYKYFGIVYGDVGVVTTCELHAGSMYVDVLFLRVGVEVRGTLASRYEVVSGSLYDEKR
jgi:hypothetical protein